MKALGIMGVILALLGGFMVAMGISGMGEFTEIQDGILLEGEILNSRTSLGPRTGNSTTTYYEIQYAYHYLGQDYASNWRGIPYEAWSRLGIGDPLEVLVSPGDPNLSIPRLAQGANHTDLVAALIMGGVFLLVGIGLFLMALFVKKKPTPKPRS